MKVQNICLQQNPKNTAFGFDYLNYTTLPKKCFEYTVPKKINSPLARGQYKKWFNPLTETILEIKKYMIHLKRNVKIKRTVFNERVSPNYTYRYTQDLYPNGVKKTKRKGTDKIIETVLETPKGNWWHKIKTKEGITLETGTPLGTKKYVYNPETKKYILSL